MQVATHTNDNCDEQALGEAFVSVLVMVCFLPGAAGRAEHGRNVLAAASKNGRDSIALDW